MHALDKALGDPAVVLLLCVTGGWRCPSAPDLGALTKRGEGKHSREKRRSNKFKAKVDQGWVKEPVYLFSTYSMLRIENSGIFKNFILYWGIYCCCLVAKSCQTLCDPMDCRCQSRGVPWLCQTEEFHGSSVHGTVQAGILQWVGIPFSRGFSQPRDWTWVSCIAGGFFTTEPPGKPILRYSGLIKLWLGYGWLIKLWQVQVSSRVIQFYTHTHTDTHI